MVGIFSIFRSHSDILVLILSGCDSFPQNQTQVLQHITRCLTDILKNYQTWVRSLPEVNDFGLIITSLDSIWACLRCLNVAQSFVVMFFCSVHTAPAASILEEFLCVCSFSSSESRVSKDRGRCVLHRYKDTKLTETNWSFLAP